MRTSFLTKLMVASSSGLPFKTVWNRMCCADNGHDLDKSILLDKLQSEKHPHTGHNYVYTLNIRFCKVCEMIFMDNGLESRVRHEDVANDHKAFMVNDSAPSLRAILKMMDTNQPIEHVRIEVHHLLMRTNRTI